jgi:hypothetical protein
MEFITTNQHEQKMSLPEPVEGSKDASTSSASIRYHTNHYEQRQAFGVQVRGVRVVRGKIYF